MLYEALEFIGRMHTLKPSGTTSRLDETRKVVPNPLIFFFKKAVRDIRLCHTHGITDFHWLYRLGTIDNDFHYRERDFLCLLKQAQAQATDLCLELYWDWWTYKQREEALLES